MNSLPNLIVRLSQDPFNSDLNFDVAEEYLRLNQTASAVSFYLRCVEYSEQEEDLKAYTSLLRMSQCFNDQRGREYSVNNCLLQAISYDDTRPEAYMLLAQFYEKAQQWQESYTWAKLGIGWFWNDEPLPADMGYYGKYCNEFQEAVAGWWVGRKDEALATLSRLSQQDLHPVYAHAVKVNLEKLNALL
jgi:tetratricopeptide (TPR) repeat protein